MSQFNLADYSFDAIIFDCDGTLVDSAPLHLRAFKIALEQQGASLKDQWYLDRVGLSRVKILTEFNLQSSTAIDIPLAAAESEAQFQSSTNELNEISEIADIARNYHQKLPLAVASSGQRLSVCKSLQSVGLLHLFDHILTAQDASACKPDPAIYIAAANKLDIEISRCLVFEDSNEGLLSATTAGAQAVDVRLFCATYDR